MGTSIDEPGLRIFASSLRYAIAKYERDGLGDLTAQQRQQLELLSGLESEFRLTLKKNRYGSAIYKAFIHKICDKSGNGNGNILTARPFFRERQDVCNGPISDALERKDDLALAEFHVNYHFVLFVLKQKPWPSGSRLSKLARRIEAIRRQLVEVNMPLAISQARLFWSKSPSKAPSCHLTYLDFIQIACDGLLSAVDKFVLPDAAKFPDPEVLAAEFRRFRPMAVQRMVGNFIEEYTSPLLHFFPKDKRKLYRANKLVHRYTEKVDFGVLAEQVNRDASGKLVSPNYRTSASDLVSLMAASTGVASTDDNGVDEEGTILDRYVAGAESRPDVQYEKAENASRLRLALAELTIFERKMLRLKGMGLDSL